MGSVGVPFAITPGLEAVWGVKPSLEEVRRLMRVFTFNESSVNDDLAQLRLRAATRPGVHEAYASMFPAPRQDMVDAMALDETVIAALPHDTLIIHGRDDRVIPMSNSLRLLELIDNSQLHVFARCGHWVQIEHGARFVKLVEGFLIEGERSGIGRRLCPVNGTAQRCAEDLPGAPARPWPVHRDHAP